MIVYSFDKDGYYNGQTVAQPDPLMGGYLRPANSTALAPPAVDPGQIAKWTPNSPQPDDGSWSAVPDPAFAAQQALIRRQHLIVFYRNEDGKDAAVLGWGRFGTIAQDGGLVLYQGKPMSDPANAKVAYQEFESDPVGYDAKNDNQVSTAKIVNGTVISRDENDIFLDDIVAQGKRLIIFYRNITGYDTKVLSSAPHSSAYLNGILQYQGKPISDPSNSGVGYLVSDTLTILDVSVFNDNGVQTRKVNVTTGNIVARTATAIAKDRDNTRNLNEVCDQQIAQALAQATGMPIDTEYTTHLMIVQHAQDVKLYPELYTAQDLSSADATLNIYRPLFQQIQQCRADRDTALAALDPA